MVVREEFGRECPVYSKAGPPSSSSTPSYMMSPENEYRSEYSTSQPNLATERWDRKEKEDEEKATIASLRSGLYDKLVKQMEMLNIQMTNEMDSLLVANKQLHESESIIKEGIALLTEEQVRNRSEFY
jgi:hypothetical protein